MAKRVFDIAKELKIESRVIVAKCHAEGIPESVIKNHMSTVSVGLEATIREWFSGEHNTAVETAEPVDLDKARAKPKRKAKPLPMEGDSDGVATAVVAPPAEPPVDREAPASAPSSPEPEPSRALRRPAPPPPAPARAIPAPIVPPPPPPMTVEDAAPAAPVEAGPAEARPVEAKKVAASPAPVAPPPPPPARVQPAPQNVPMRPKVVAPAGPKLQVQAPVKLSGPKVVRVEAPEIIEAPRPRRAPGDGPSGPRYGRGPGAPTEEEESRGGGGAGGGGSNQQRRGGANKRRTTGDRVDIPARRRATSGEEWKPTGVFSEQDLIEREARLNRAGGFLKKRRQDLKKQGTSGGGERALTAAETGGVVKIGAPFTIKDLSAATGVKVAEISKKLLEQGLMLGANSGIEPAKAAEIMLEFDIELEVVSAKTAEESVSEEFGERVTKDERARGPVVTILGHVDHGKTSLLDKIRNANVAAGEAGGITQRTSAFRVPVKVGDDEKQVVFLDTPGHEAFTSMRSRGANMTDVVVLVVSAPEGVMPQTLESISHAQAAKVPIVVALNKIDRPDATQAAVQKTLGQLAEAGLNPVEWGGETEIVRTSAVNGTGITELLETLDYQSQLLELKADFDGPGRGVVIEARTEEGRGPVASLLVQQGMLRVGDFVVAGRAFGRVRDITDDRGTRQREATPPMPVQISGLDEVPDAGDKFYVVDSLKKAQEAAEQRRQRERHAQLAQPKVTLDRLFSQLTEADTKEILIVLKAAEQGTVDVLRSECEKVKSDEVRVRVLHAAVGGITESDVLLADASKAIVIGFNVIPTGKSRQLADSKGVEIRTYDVIYNITDDLRQAAEGLLAPELRQEVLGHAEVRKVFKVSRVGTIAGCYITDGTVQRDALIRVTRQGVVIENGRVLEQLKRFKDDAKDVRAGMECGMKIVGYDDIKEGDILECYKNVEVKRTL